MSALHRLKAYFGMVPVEEFDAEEFSPAGFDSYQAGHCSGYPEPADGSQAHDSFAIRAGHQAAPRMQPASPPAWAAEAQVAQSCPTAGSCATASRPSSLWGTQAPVRGSLAIDPMASNVRSTMGQPVAPQRVRPARRTGPLSEGPLNEDAAHPLARIVTLHPRNYNEARPIGERYREGNPVIMNLTAMEDRDAKRLVDFAAGLAFALRGSIDKVTNKVFLLSPPNVDVSAEDRRRIAEGRFFG